MSNTIHIFSFREQIVANARPLFRSLQPSRILMERNIDPRFDVVVVRPDGGYHAMIMWQSVHHVDQEWHQFVYGPSNPSPAGALAALFAETVRLLTEARGWVATVRTDFEINSTQGASLVTMDTALAQSALWQRIAGHSTGAGVAQGPPGGAVPSNVHVTRSVAPGSARSQDVNANATPAPGGAAAAVSPSQGVHGNVAQAPNGTALTAAPQAINTNVERTSHPAPIANTPGNRTYTQGPHSPPIEIRAPTASFRAREAVPKSASIHEVKKEERMDSDNEMST
ncbi:hypothetical protein LTR95_012892 [Oleoguttula sp. CCFEE 5521]